MLAYPPRQNGRVEQRGEAQLLQQRVPHEDPGVRENPQHSGANGRLLGEFDCACAAVA